MPYELATTMTESYLYKILIHRNDCLCKFEPTFLHGFGGFLDSSLRILTTSCNVSRTCFRYASNSDSIVIPPIGLEKE